MRQAILTIRRIDKTRQDSYGTTRGRIDHAAAAADDRDGGKGETKEFGVGAFDAWSVAYRCESGDAGRWISADP